MDIDLCREAEFWLIVTKRDDSMCFRAFNHPRETVIFDVRAVDLGHSPVGQHLVFSHDLRSFLDSPALRGRLVSDAISTMGCFSDSAASLYWKDQVSRNGIEEALALHCSSKGRGFRFAIHFHLDSLGHGVLRAERVWRDDDEAIDDVLVVGGGGGSRRRYGKMRRLRFKDDGSFKEEECAICFQEYGEEDLGRMTSCSHTFHHRCIAKWLQLNPSCPLCRREVDAPMLTMFDF